MSDDRFLRKYDELLKDADSIEAMERPHLKPSSLNRLTNGGKSFHGWAASAANLIKISHGEGSIHYEAYKGAWDAARKVNYHVTFTDFQHCQQLLISAMRDYEDGFIEENHRPDLLMVVTLCSRIHNAANILNNRKGKKKPLSYKTEDEYDVQDFLQAVLRGYLKYTVQENPLEKIAGIRAGRTDISIEDLGIIIEIKYARDAGDGQLFLKAFSDDLLLYPKWPYLKTLIFLVYNSSSLLDPESLTKLSGRREQDGKRFDVEIILV